MADGEDIWRTHLLLHRVRCLSGIVVDDYPAPCLFHSEIMIFSVCHDKQMSTSFFPNNPKPVLRVKVIHDTLKTFDSVML